MSESDIEDENILEHFQEALHRAEVSEEFKQSLGVEYACLRSMMLEPQNTTMWNALALVYMVSDRASDAADAIEKSLEIDTSNAWTWTIWGDLLRQEGRLSEAEQAYRMSMELDPSDKHTARHLAALYSLRNAHPEALELLQMLISKTPNDQELWDFYSSCLERLKK